MTPDVLLVRWVAICALAELLGLGAAGAWYGVANLLLGEPEPFWLRLGAWAAMASAAIPEALILGGLQAMALRAFWPAISIARWIAATLLVGLIGWGVGAGVPLFGPYASGAQGAEPSAQAVILFAAVFGLGAGLLFGVAQAWAIPKGVRRRWAWIVANTLGWAIALPLTYVAGQAAADLSGFTPRVALYGLGGLGAGLTIGLATACALAFMPTDGTRSARDGTGGTQTGGARAHPSDPARPRGELRPVHARR
jgi:hypothetical protein